MRKSLGTVKWNAYCKMRVTLANMDNKGELYNGKKDCFGAYDAGLDCFVGHFTFLFME